MKIEMYKHSKFKVPIEISINYDCLDNEYIVVCEEFREYGNGVTELLAKKDLVISIFMFYDFVKDVKDNRLGSDFKRMKDRLKEIIV